MLCALSAILGRPNTTANLWREPTAIRNATPIHPHVEKKTPATLTDAFIPTEWSPSDTSKVLTCSELSIDRAAAVPSSLILLVLVFWHERYHWSAESNDTHSKILTKM